MNKEKISVVQLINNVSIAINNELVSKQQHSIEYYLYSNDVDTTMQYIINNSDLYCLIKEENNGYIYKYLCLVKKYYNSLFLSKDKQIDKYFKKLKQPSNIIYDKQNVLMPPIEINRTIRLFEEALIIFENIYNDKTLIATLRNGDEIPFHIRRKELLHLLGITTENIKQNKEFLDLMGLKLGARPSHEDIIHFILKDFKTNRDITAIEYDRVKRLVNEPNYVLSASQFNNSVTTELLNFQKIRLKSQAFIKSGPFEEVFMVAKLAEGKRLTKYSDSNIAMISESKISSKYPWSYMGSVQEQNTCYTSTLIIDSAAGKGEKFEGSIPSIATKVVTEGLDGEGEGIIFSEEEQIDLLINAYTEFKEYMDFNQLKEDYIYNIEEYKGYSKRKQK